MPLIIGLTGGIGSGKTLISDHFASLGIEIIDTDIIARQIVAPNSHTLKQLTNTFGLSIINSDGSLNRAQLRSIAFSSSSNKVKLDAITHPAIHAETLTLIKQVSTPYCIVVVPLLISSDGLNPRYKSLIHRILLVTAPKQLKIKRIQKRSGLERKEINQIMQSQVDDSICLELADDIVQNNQDINFALQQVEKLDQHYAKLALKYN